MEEVETEQWGDELSIAGRTVLRADDIVTINRRAESGADRAWALEVTAGLVRDDAHDPLATKRSKDNDAWLVLVA